MLLCVEAFHKTHPLLLLVWNRACGRRRLLLVILLLIDQFRLFVFPHHGARIGGARVLLNPAALGR